MTSAAPRKRLPSATTPAYEECQTPTSRITPRL
eukprot:CAMPEP_0174839116 /NCGR_PEP_ID=MMETSP1114-20130205/7844_1 /TAXON_ID=312471 /ORGANISM="Neobodo designis, Strain CCAP 1951/1" /LENGTH=32 /DNA_ID= /DNA_START= /DNA_END= /DNA_ORIENTATION=